MKRGKQAALPKTVDDYLAALPPEVQAVLEQLRHAIKTAALQAEELISYRIPTYKYLGPLVHFAAFKDHCSFIVVNKSIITEFKTKLQGFKTTGTTIHFTAENPLPAELVQEIVKTRISQNEALKAE